MASKSAQAAGENPDVVEEQLEALDKMLDRLKVLYEQYFLGMLKQPPTFIHTDVERKIREVTQMQIRNTALRYRFVTLQQKFGAYNAYWKRTLRQIEKGTYIRNLVKVSKRAALGEDIPEEILQAMPKRMREQVRKDREAARARARNRPGTNGGLGADDFDIDVDDLSAEPVDAADEADSAAFINEPSELRRQARASNRHVIEEPDDDFDFDAFFKGVEQDDESTGIRSIPKPDDPPPKPVPLPRATAPGMPAARPPAQAAPPADPARQHLRTPVAGVPVPQRTTQPQRAQTDLDFDDFREEAPRRSAPMQAQPEPRRSAPMQAQPDPTNTPPPQRRSQPVMQQPDPRTPPPQRRSQPVVAQPDPTAAARPSTQTPPAGTPRPVMPMPARPQTPPAGLPTVARPQTPLPVKPPVIGYPKPTPASGVPAARANERTPASGITIPPVPASIPIPVPKRAMPSVPPPPAPAPPPPSATATPDPDGPADRPSQRPLLRPPSVLRRQGLTRPPPTVSAGSKTPPPERREDKLKPPPGMSDADVNALYAKYVKAKEMVGETTGPGSYGKLLQTINSQAPKIMEQYKSKGVDFSVVVKDNQVIIKAKPK